jgi:hypothetical protein
MSGATFVLNGSKNLSRQISAQELIFAQKQRKENMPENICHRVCHFVPPETRKQTSGGRLILKSSNVEKNLKIFQRTKKYCPRAEICAKAEERKHVVVTRGI